MAAPNYLRSAPDSASKSSAILTRNVNYYAHSMHVLLCVINSTISTGIQVVSTEMSIPSLGRNVTDACPFVGWRTVYDGFF